MLRLKSLAVLLLLAFPCAVQAMKVQGHGAVAAAGQFEVPAFSRLSAVMLALRPTPAAYLSGGALLRESAKRDQRRMKAGLLHDLQQLSQRDEGQWSALHDWVESLPVTGRVSATLDPRRIELDKVSDRFLEEGDSLHIPMRPKHVMVVGAVDAPCRLDFKPQMSPDRLISQCALSDKANKDWAWLVQPDGQIRRVGIATWNRTHNEYLAPGGVVIAGIDSRVLGTEFERVNDELAAFLATQVLAVKP